jgi:hypothetical protein
MWRACEWPRLIFPVAVVRNRLAAPLWVLSLGMSTLSFQVIDNYCQLPIADFKNWSNPIFQRLQIANWQSAIGN